jgi:DNA-binding FadR family transcriptional regulator
MGYGQAMSTLGAGVNAVTTDTVVSPVRGGNPFEEAVARIVQAIKLGIVNRGERLPPERELALQLGVSRVTLRAAIRALQQAGYIESRRGRTGGSFVVWDPAGTSGDPQRIAVDLGVKLIDALQFRSVIEPGAAALAARRTDLTDKERKTLVTRLDESSRAKADAYRLADCRLHLAIAELSGCSSLQSAIADVQLLLNDVLRAIPLLRSAIKHSNEQHRLIVEAVLDGRPTDARSVMEEHVDATASLLRGFLD